MKVRRSIQAFILQGCLAFLFGVLFLLPHLVRISEIGSYQAYSPFSASSNSSLVWDESFLYAAEANFSLTRHFAPAYSDTWEQRNAPYPYAILPTEAEALVADGVGGLTNAHLLLNLIFPALTFLLLGTVFRRCGAGPWTGAFLAAGALLCSFSVRTILINDRSFLTGWHGESSPLLLGQGRIPIPSLTLPLLICSVLLLATAMREQRKMQEGIPSATGSSSYWPAIGAGAIGGAFFYCYVYYAISWAGAIALLSVCAFLYPKRVSRIVWLPFSVTVAEAIPFLLWKHKADAEHTYLPRSQRLGLHYGHRLEPGSLGSTVFWGIVAVSGAVALWRMRSLPFISAEAGTEEKAGAARSTPSIAPGWSYAQPILLVLVAMLFGGLAGLNMQVVTGFNAQAALHFPHMVLQPLGTILVAILLALASPLFRKLELPASVGFFVLIGCAAISQFEASRETGSQFRVDPSHRAFYTWLNTQTPTNSVVATDDLALSVILPVNTHNDLLFGDGSRTTATDAELIERFLLASRLAGASSDQVRAELVTPVSAHTSVPEATFTAYLFEASSWANAEGDHRIRPERIDEIVRWFSSMIPSDELARFRVDYVWTQPGRHPPEVRGWSLVEVFSSPDGTLWRLAPSGAV